MSLPDNQIEDDSRECTQCGTIFLQCGGKGNVCWGCCEDSIDLYADMKIQDAFEKEGK